MSVNWTDSDGPLQAENQANTIAQRLLQIIIYPSFINANPATNERKESSW
ncbi:MAG: hypothetical protein ACTJHU_03390 [Mycetocola sp.]